MILCIATVIPHNFRISTQIPHIPTLILRTRIPIPFLAFPPLFSGIPSFWSPIPHFGFYRYSTQFVFFKYLFSENSCFSSKMKTPLFYYCITLGTKLLFTSSMTSSVLSPKIIYLILTSSKKCMICVKCEQRILSVWSVTYVFCQKGGTTCPKL